MGRIAFAALVLIVFCSPALSWGDQGHQIVCEIAYRLSAPDTRAMIRKLISGDQQYDTFSESCVFPDHPRKRASEHFVNLRRDMNRLTSDECPDADKCVVTAIKNDSDVLSSRARRIDKLTALKFLGH